MKFVINKPNPRVIKKHFKSNNHKQFDKCKHKELNFENPDISNIDRAFYDYIIHHNKNIDYYLVKCQFKIVCNDHHHCQY